MLTVEVKEGEQSFHLQSPQ